MKRMTRMAVVLCVSASLVLVSNVWATTETGAAKEVKGFVFDDRNQNGVRDPGEPGIPRVSVSNGKEVVRTDERGRYTLPAYDEMTVFISKPAGFAPPLNENNIPKFFYLHAPKGSPPEIKKYPGIGPTGDLPAMVNFPLQREYNSKNFKAIITGDTQVYTNKEIEYLRDSFVKEVSGTDAAFVLCMGDNIGDHLDLYPRFMNAMSNIGRPIYLVPGNHDANLADAPDPAHAYETFKAQVGPTYYSFNYGDVHFVVLNDIAYPGCF